MQNFEEKRLKGAALLETKNKWRSHWFLNWLRPPNKKGHPSDDLSIFLWGTYYCCTPSPWKLTCLVKLPEKKIVATFVNAPTALPLNPKTTDA